MNYIIFRTLIFNIILEPISLFTGWGLHSSGQSLSLINIICSACVICFSLLLCPQDILDKETRSIHRISSFVDICIVWGYVRFGCEEGAVSGPCHLEKILWWGADYRPYHFVRTDSGLYHLSRYCLLQTASFEELLSICRNPVFWFHCLPATTPNLIAGNSNITEKLLKTYLLSGDESSTYRNRLGSVHY